MRLPSPCFRLVILNHITWNTTERFSTRKIPQSIGMSNSFRVAIANTAIIPPMVKLPVSPIKTWAGYVLYQRKPTREPAKAVIKIVISPERGIYMILR